MATKTELSTRRYNWSAAVKLAVATSSAATTNAIGFSEILLFSTTDCWVTFATTPTAVADTAGNLFLSAGEKYHLQVNPAFKLAAIRATADGSIHIIPTD